MIEIERFFKNIAEYFLFGRVKGLTEISFPILLHSLI